MAEPVLTETRIRAGLWEGVLRADPAGPVPEVEVRHLDRRVEGATLASIPDKPGHWALRVPVPVQALSDGVQTFVILSTTSGATLGHFTIVTGADRGEDLRAEVDLLRAELDMLKRAFRRHCLETM
ncbi:hypothetical protein SAMN05421774_10936 [Gemmobacter megaterium]|uniref:Uncharacterized protein n=1 Tax=Gemmobacter megaterium TaxID=1086013 RepID=A0A1N7QCW7_9RHOB|nr:hypothetical protein [Gemmobacter megaterium]GGE25313.1 hypothetical protein GCM10011345_34030 [Gemmobacter megaterium]SIT20710.1 hypothetical protein SAMN05421774_10936 [Gemmobacter megaterium]